MSGPLGVSHLMIFNQTDVGVNLRIARCSRGPTCTFRVNKFSLIADILRSHKRPRAPGTEFNTQPLVSGHPHDSSKAPHQHPTQTLFPPCSAACLEQLRWRSTTSEVPRDCVPKSVPADSSAEHASFSSSSSGAFVVQRSDRDH